MGQGMYAAHVQLDSQMLARKGRRLTTARGHWIEKKEKKREKRKQERTSSIPVLRAQSLLSPNFSQVAAMQATLTCVMAWLHEGPQ